jgi:ubiquinone biosynthesis protein
MDAVIARHDRAALARKLVHGFLRQAMIGGFFHADLHPGNLFVAEDGALVAVDFGIMGRLSKDTSRFLALILKGFVERDYRGIAQVHVDAGYVGRDRDIEAFAQALRAVGEPVFDRPAAEISMGRLLTQLFEVTERFDMHTQPQLLMLQKTMVVVEGVARNLDPSMNIFEAARPIIEEWMREYLGPSAFMRDLRDAAGRLVDWIRQQRPPEPEPVTIPVPAKIEPAAPVLWHWLAAGAFILSLLAVALELLRHPG